MDEYNPASKTGSQSTPEGAGWMIVDALDNLILMNLTSRLAHARDWIATSLNYTQDTEVNTFETTVRMLGGLLSAHYLTSTFPDLAPLEDIDEDLFIEKATDLADRLIGAFDSASGVPYANLNLETRNASPAEGNDGATPLAEAAAVTLEWKYLAMLLGERLYWSIAEKAVQIVDDHGAKDGLVPPFIDPVSGEFVGSRISISDGGDAYYESLLKQYLQTSKQETIYRTLWDEALRGIRTHLITYSSAKHLTILAERPDGLDEPLNPKMDHRACFLPGTIALGATGGLTAKQARKNHHWGPKQENELRVARELTKTCFSMAMAMDPGLSPESVNFDIDDPPLQERDGPFTSERIDWKSDESHWRDEIHVDDARHRQRPETVEALFYMYRVTGDHLYREWAWTLFSNWVEHSLMESGGFVSLNSVDSMPPEKGEVMEGWWLSGSLKYLYLLFGESDLLPLDEVVFNTQGHPFPVFELQRGLKTGWDRKERDMEGRIVEKHDEEEKKEDGEDEEKHDDDEEEHNDDEDAEKHEEEDEEKHGDEEPEDEHKDEEEEEEEEHHDDEADNEKEDEGEGDGEDDEDDGPEEPFSDEPEEDNQPQEDVEEDWSWSIRDLR
jgi:endoplasmic reticulum Man9GlcNAc2 1,2-alpha-mannosidase